MTTVNTEELRQFKSDDEIIAALSIPGTVFYEVLWKSSGIREHVSHGVGTSDRGSVFIHTEPPGHDDEFRAREYVRDMQNNPNKGVFTDRAIAEKFHAACQTWNDDPRNEAMKMERDHEYEYRDPYWWY